MKNTSLSLLSRNRSIFASLLMAAVATVSQTDKAAAFDLKFNATTAVATDADYIAADPFGFGFGAGYSRSAIRYTNVAPGVAGALGNGLDAVFTATAKGTNYSFVEHIPNFRSATTTAPTTTAAAYQDAAFLYQIAGTSTAGATGLGKGGLDYKIELFERGTNTRYTADALRLLVYDVDGEGAGTTNLRQDEAVRIAKGAGLVGYQVGSSAQALIPTQDATSYLFSGRGINVAETDKSGAAIFYFANVNQVNFQFEADTLAPSSADPNPVFSGIDGDLSLYGTGALTGFATRVDTSATATAVPEPFTIIGTLVGGTAALRMRKKLKADKA
ncbi:PEP-CTERM sorting domain-containing protein [Chamaesiphon sp. GL140_3_metabinner_50]|uniref:PEP-CTERM sorting domain-containing protein n=1 Tax=Chamaesiphon sp. GL140_3_metabinner_50 TaxID=2970812 RepID=UPI0025FB1583|nr:PEP-CTERM sorting domain-containing protein [Chamaesiphon sp. GL140_3_metabinner_50]